MSAPRGDTPVQATSIPTPSPIPDALEQRHVQLGFERARLAADMQKWATAVALLRSGLESEPDRADCLSLYGYCLARLGERLEEARTACRRAVDVQSYVAAHHAHLGFVYRTAGLEALAAQHFDTALRLDPANELAAECAGAAHVRSWRGRVRQRLQRLWRRGAPPRPA
jgi:tetratricopeptide (TPR) repeat protein